MQRQHLIDSILAHPEDMLARYALADCLEEEGEPDVARLVRIVPELMKVPFPEKPRREFELYLKQQPGGRFPPELSRVRLLPSMGLNLCSHSWYGGHATGRLVGIGAVWGLARRHGWPCRQDIPPLQELATIELYACGLIDARRRDRLLDHVIWASPHEAATLILRGGKAGRSLHAMSLIESSEISRALSQEQARQMGYLERKALIHRPALCLIRSYHMDLLEHFGRLEPWLAALNLRDRRREASRQKYLQWRERQ